MSRGDLRILVTGNAGTGKSTLAADLSELLEIECFGLDQIVWQPGWKTTPKAQQRDQIEALAAREAWIIDGVSSILWRRADVVILLDFKRRVSLFRCAKRNWRFLFRSRPGLPEGCPEILIIPRLIEIIWKFPKTVRPRLISDFQNVTDRQLIIVRDRADLVRLREETVAQGAERFRDASTNFLESDHV